jgi:translation initiation factor IF-1
VRVPKVAAQQNTKEAPLEVIGSIKQVFPSATFSVELDNGHIVLGHIAGRLRRHRIRILPGDRVDLELSPYDLTKGRIVYRYRAGEERRTSQRSEQLP